MFGAVFARKQIELGKRVLVIEKRGHIGGNCFTENIEGVAVHRYGPHIFHTDNPGVWEFVNRFAVFNAFVNRPKVFHKNRLYSFPVNLMTLYQLYGVRTPTEARKKLEEVAIPIKNPANLEEWVLSRVGPDIYEIFIRGYTKKQWQKEPRELPASLLKRIPIRFTFDDNYYTDRFQGIPVDGYTRLFERMLEGIEVQLETDYLEDKKYWDRVAEKIVYTGKLDEYFDYSLGELEYRGLRFETEIKNGDYQGNAVINYTEEEVPYTRIIEHKHFNYTAGDRTVITREFPAAASRNSIPYYPVNTPDNNRLYGEYRKKAETEKNLILGGRLATYKYLDMDDAVLSALQTAGSTG